MGNVNSLNNKTDELTALFVDCATRKNRTIDLLYANVKDAYSATPLPPLGSSDHNLIHLQPLYVPKVQRLPTTTRTFREWTPVAEETLRDCFEITDWHLLQGSDDLEEATACTTDYINFCMDIVAPTKTVRCYPNNKPWVTSEVKQLLNRKKKLFKEGNFTELRSVQRELKSTLKEAKVAYGRKVEKKMSDNSREAWQGLRNITGCGKKRCMVDGDPSMANDLNQFYNRFGNFGTGGGHSVVTSQAPSPPQPALDNDSGNDPEDHFSVGSDLPHSEPPTLSDTPPCDKYMDTTSTHPPALPMASTPTICNSAIAPPLMDTAGPPTPTVATPRSSPSPLPLETTYPPPPSTPPTLPNLIRPQPSLTITSEQLLLAGFYGRPWSMEQRKVLFQWMQRWGLNTYLYGPKDDLKHRLLWRELYTPEEEVQVRTLICEAEARGLSFVYALSPGQDIIFSSACDLSLLKRKLSQVSELGCKAFAILFDDIDHSMCQADSEAFSSFAHAQVSVTNEIYSFLGEPPIFLFCPTEYCDSLCSPSVAKSPYLLTVGEDLMQGIAVIWTGSRVISRELSADSLSEVRTVLQRPPLLWDNLHANDYDSRRVFLGPFKGRPPGLHDHLSGLLLNPNCEFEANYIPLHTLGAWHRCGQDNGKDEAGQYCSDRALNTALVDWIEELNQPLLPGKTLTATTTGGAGEPKPSKPSTEHYSGGSGSSSPPGKESSTAPLRSPSEPPQRQAEGKQAATSPTSPTSATSATTPTSATTTTSATSPTPIVPAVHSNGDQASRADSHSSTRSLVEKPLGRGLSGGKNPLSESQVRLLVGLHYLPHEYGPAAKGLLQDLTWLKAHCHYVSANGHKKKALPHKVEEWRARAVQFLSACDQVALLHEGVVNSVNRAVLYDLYPYVWDLRNTLLVAKAFVSWLEGRILSDSSTSGSWKNCFHWCGTTPGSEMMGVESEPWAFKGGLCGEMQLLLPMGTSPELFIHPPPLFPSARLYNVRPFHSKDKMELYRMVRQLHQRARGQPDLSVIHPDFYGDRCLGAVLALCPEYSLVLEDELGVCGCALGILDVRHFAKRWHASWLPAMRDKYPPQALGMGTGSSGHQGTKEALQCFKEETPDYPDSLLFHFPSQLRLDALPELVDCSVSRSLLTALLTALKANGSRGVFCEVQPMEQMRMEFLTKLGFLEILRVEASTREGLVLGRLL
ncbi:protein O-GlcNAcase [Engraulis encrasicolus]|uniref:protein O-GlcNAcase n=1 Tax=Engraulis encrasicolus TaxID=184585 RepID=UPI002FD4D12E